MQKSGAAIVNDTERDKTMVQEMLELKSKVDKIIKSSFQNEEKFHDAVRVSSSIVISAKVTMAVYYGTCMWCRKTWVLIVLTCV